MRYVLLFLVLIVAAGALIMFRDELTHVGTPDDPNDPRRVGTLSPEVLRQMLAGISDSILEHFRRDSVTIHTTAEFKALMKRAANNLLSGVNIKRIPPAKAWEYGQIFITAERWEDAKTVLEIAVKAAKDEDRRVNDNLQLARVLANLGDVPGAIRTAQTTFDATDTGCAPILLAVLLEIVPVAKNKGHDAELADLLEKAIACENRTIVDPKTEPGKAFLLARPHHVGAAWRMVVELYENAHEMDKARAAELRAEKDLIHQGNA